MVDFEELPTPREWLRSQGSSWRSPSDQSVLTGRMIDRSIRPLFNQADVGCAGNYLRSRCWGENDYDIVSLIAASAALSISGVEWAGPISGIRVGLIDGQFVFNPNYEQQALSDLDLIVAGTAERILMIEAGANEVSEEIMAKAIMAGQKSLTESLALINELKKAILPKEKTVYPPLKSPAELEAEKFKQELIKKGTAWLEEKAANILFDETYYTKRERKLAISEIKDQLNKYLFSLEADRADRAYVIKNLVDTLVEAEITKAILEKDHRVDLRKLDQVRDLVADVAILPRVHGSSLFSRGETQVMSIITLGAPGLEQSLEWIEGASKKRYMHANFPYSVGESPLRGVGRREITWSLAEKAWWYS